VDAAGQAVQRNPPDGSFYDASGNRVYYGSNRTVSYAVSPGGVADLVERTIHYYGADERLRVVDRRACAFGYRDGKHQCFPPSQSARPTFEEYRYDALGRRVLVRTRQAWACGNNCVDAALRTVWDGDRELHEIRAPATALEQDEGPVPAGTPFPRQYGRVAYLHGAALDRPLAIYRLHYDTIFPDALHLVPHANWHGDFDGGLYNGEPAPPCRTFRKNPVDHEPAPGVEIPGDAVVPVEMDTVCMEVQWPAAYLWMNGRTRQDNPAGAPSWMGSLIAGRRDATGQVYLRNRYYDPLTGRFTQEDPIGLAGGINLYGFADGDPVGYSDPYGLSPTDDYYYNTRGSVIRVNKTVTEDRHYMVANDGKPNQIVIELDGRPIAGSTPYRFINDPSALDREAKFLGSSEDDTYRNPLEFARQSRNHGGDLDFKPDLNRRWGVRTLWNAGGGLYVHNDKVGNAAWGYYTAHRTMFPEDFAVSQATKAARQTNPSGVGEALDAQFIRRGWHIP
jgi:RHS repeat-associated protein